MVEASAGTGKTFAIAMLVLRFVAEFGVPVEELLVVSYTRAATEELRTRIRKRLLEARDFLREEEKAIDDEVLFRCLDQLPDKRLALERLELALLDMDRASVFTIHSFCCPCVMRYISHSFQPRRHLHERAPRSPAARARRPPPRG